jgi:dTDP-4-amino-4,6-dideoxygalactose transaminase
MRALGVSIGDTVVCAANAGGYATTAALLVGAEVLYADIDLETHMLTVESLSKLIDEMNRLPRAIVVTHLYGAAAPVLEIVAWAKPMGIAVIEDCAQALGAFDGDQRVGSIGDIATTSFYPTKNLGALGDGGAIFTQEAGLAAKVVSLRQYGWKSKYNSTLPMGTNSRLDELQAAVLLNELVNLDKNNEKRRAIHSKYEESSKGAVRFVNKASPRFVGHLAVIEVENREAAVQHFASRGIDTAIHYPIPDHQQLSREGFRNPVSLSNTEYLVDKILTLPLFPELSETEVNHVRLAISELG